MSRAGTRSRPASSSSTRARTTSIRSTSARFRAARTTRTASSCSATARRRRHRSGIANMALGVFSNYAEIGQRAFTKWRALATDIFVQDSWKPTSNLTIEGGIRWAFWPPWYSQTNNIANFDPRFYDHGTARRSSIRRPAGSLAAIATTASSCRATGSRATASDLVVAQDPRVLALFRGEPRGFSETHYNAVRAAPWPVVSDQRQDDRCARAPVSSTTASRSTTRRCSAATRRSSRWSASSNGSVDNPGGGGSGADGSAVRDAGAGRRVQAPDGLHVVGGVQREMPFGFVVDVTYVGRRGLYLQRERNINQLLPGTIQANPACQHRGAASLQGLRRDPPGGERRPVSIYNSLQISADRRYSNGLKVGVAYTLGKSEDNASDKRNVLWNTYDDTNYWGAVELRPPARAERLLHLRSAVLARAGRVADEEPAGRVADLRRDLLPHGHAVLDRRAPTTSRVSATGLTASRSISSATSECQRQRQVLRRVAGVSDRSTSSSTRRRLPTRPPGTFGNAPRNLLRNPGDQQWDIAFFKNFALGGARSKRSSARRSSTS